MRACRVTVMARFLQQPISPTIERVNPIMDRRISLATTAAALGGALLPAASLPALAAATSADDAKKFIDGLSDQAIGSLTGSSVSESEREARFRTLLQAHFDLP